MSTIFFLSDLHLGHEGALKWARQWRDGDTVDEHDQILIDKIKTKVTKRDQLYLLGDVSWRTNKLHLLEQIRCQKFLVRGNHDVFPLEDYLKYFDNIYGLINKKGYWLSHAPIHPSELRDRPNIHGHTHSTSIRDAYHQYDTRYINVSVEILDGYPISLEEIRDGTYWKIRKNI